MSNPNQPSNKIVFDKTINLGHILTFLGFMAAMATLYMNVNTRLTMLEQSALYQVKRDEAQDLAIRDGKNEIRESLKEIYTALNKLADTVDKLREARK